MRYEEPSSMVRWDSPLITVPWIDDDIPADDIWKAITEGNVKPPNAGTQAVRRLLCLLFLHRRSRSGTFLFCLQVPKAPTDALRALEATTTAMVSAIMAEQAASGSLGGPVALTLPNSLRPTVTLPPRTVTLSELQRLKRQFVTVNKKAITLGTIEKGAMDWSEESIADKYAAYIEENLKP